jgi:hypothetical protein
MQYDFSLHMIRVIHSYCTFEAILSRSQLRKYRETILNLQEKWQKFLSLISYSFFA